MASPGIASMAGMAKDPYAEVAHWREKAKVKEHEVKLLRQMVESARDEIARRDKNLESVAMSLSRQENSKAHRDMGQSDALRMVESLERDISEKEKREKIAVAENKLIRAQLDQQNEKLADVNSIWERQMAQLRAARDADVKLLEDKVRREVEEKQEMKVKLEECHALVATMKRELLERESKISVLEARYAEKVAIKDKELVQLSQKNRDLELDIEHVMVAASKFARRDVKAVNNVVDLEEEEAMAHQPIPPPTRPPQLFANVITPATQTFQQRMQQQTSMYSSMASPSAYGAGEPLQKSSAPINQRHLFAQRTPNTQQAPQEPAYMRTPYYGLNEDASGKVSSTFLSSINAMKRPTTPPDGPPPNGAGFSPVMTTNVSNPAFVMQ